MDLIAVEVRRSLLKLRKILHRPQTSFRSVDLLVKKTPEAHRIQPKTPLLRANVRVEMELPRRMAIHMAIETGHTQARLQCLAIVRRIEFLLRKRRQQKP